MNSYTLHWSFEKNHKALFVLLFTLGFITNYGASEWQAAVSYGSVLSNPIGFEMSDVLYLSIANTPSIIIYLAAIALKFFKDPVFVNAIYAGLIGSLIFVSQGFFFKAMGGRKSLILLFPIILHFSGITYNLGLNYPILDPTQNVGFANLVFYISLFSLACSAVSAHRIAGVSLASLPVIHPFCGLWFAAGLFLMNLMMLQKNRACFRQFIIYSVSSGFLGISFLIYHFVTAPGFPEIAGNTNADALKIIRLHNAHASPLSLNSGMVMSLVSITLTLALTFVVKKTNLKIILIFLLTNASLSLALSMIYYLPDEVLHPSFIAPLWNRNINLNLLVLPALIFMTIFITTKKTHHLLLSLVVFLMFVICEVLELRSEFLLIPLIILCLLWIILPLVRKQKFLTIPRFNLFKGNFFLYSNKLSKLPCLQIIPSKIRHFLILFACFSFVFAVYQNSENKYNKLPHYTNDELLSEAQKIQGKIVYPNIVFETKTDLPFFVIGRVPVVDPQYINMVPYIPSLHEQILARVADWYGINLIETKNKCSRMKSSCVKSIWQSRSTKEWQELGKNYQVTSIIAPKSWTLDLPIVAENENLVLYSFCENKNC